MEIEKILNRIRTARDSVWVINDTVEKLANGAAFVYDTKNAIDANVNHLKIIVNLPEILESKEDISDLFAAIELGENTLKKYMETPSM